MLSKRLHSIYLLRLFNDCFAVAALFVAVYAYQSRRWLLGSTFCSLGLGVKMSVLLTFPAFAVVLFQGHLLGHVPRRAALHASWMLAIQVKAGGALLNDDRVKSDTFVPGLGATGPSLSASKPLGVSVTCL